MPGSANSNIFLPGKATTYAHIMVPSAPHQKTSLNRQCISSRTPPTPLGRYVDSWTPETGVTSYGGYVNEHFQDEAINCTIKWAPEQLTAGIYAKRDIRLNEELFTGYGKPQWIYTLRFFAHTLSPRTIQDAITRYNILPTDRLAPCLATQSDLSPSQPPPHSPTLAPNMADAHGPAPPTTNGSHCPRVNPTAGTHGPRTADRSTSSKFDVPTRDA